MGWSLLAGSRCVGADPKCKLAGEVVIILAAGGGRWGRKLWGRAYDLYVLGEGEKAAATGCLQKEPWSRPVDEKDQQLGHAVRALVRKERQLLPR